MNERDRINGTIPTPSDEEGRRQYEIEITRERKERLEIKDLRGFEPQVAQVLEAARPGTADALVAGLSKAGWKVFESDDPYSLEPHAGCFYEEEEVSLIDVTQA